MKSKFAAIGRALRCDAVAILITLLAWGAPPAARAANIVEIAAGNPAFSTLVAAVQAAGLAEALAGPGPFTVFAPNNAAFAKLPAGTVEALLQDTNRLRQILLYHVAPGARQSTNLSAGPLVTLQGAAARIALTNGVQIDAAAVIAADIIAANGVIHVIDEVLLPPGTIAEIAAGAPRFSTLLTAVQAAGLADALGRDRPRTVFAPNDAAFAKLPAGTVEALLQDTNRLRTILLYHLVRDRVRSTDLTAGKIATVQGAAVTVALTNGVRINDSTVIAADIEAANGVIHEIDTVLLPPPDIVEIAAANPDFSTLVTAVQAAGLADALKAAGPYSVFAPNNAAFAKLPAGTVEALLQDTNRLRHILLYHVVHGPRLRAAALSDGPVTTMQGAPLRIGISTNGVTVNQARVLATDIEAVNGIIHVIDEVILPGAGFTEPRLSAIVKGGKATLVWPFVQGRTPVLQSAPEAGGPWTAVAGPTTTADGVTKTELEAAGTGQFFRLVEVPAN